MTCIIWDSHTLVADSRSSAYGKKNKLAYRFNTQKIQPIIIKGIETVYCGTGDKKGINHIVNCVCDDFHSSKKRKFPRWNRRWFKDEFKKDSKDRRATVAMYWPPTNEWLKFESNESGVFTTKTEKKWILAGHDAYCVAWGAIKSGADAIDAMHIVAEGDDTVGKPFFTWRIDDKSVKRFD